MRKLSLFILSFSLILLCSTAFAQTTILEEDFSSGTLPSGWDRSQTLTSFGWEFGTADDLSTTIFDIPGAGNEKVAASNDNAHDNISGTQNDASLDRLITPTMNFTSYGAVILEFDYFLPGYTGSTGSIELSTNNGGSWNQVATLTTSPDWERGFVDLSLYTFASNVKIAFRHNDNGVWADGFAVDNINFYQPDPDDAGLLDLSMGDYVLLGSTPVKGKIRNNGGNTIFDFTASYTVNGGTPVSETFSGLTMLAGGDLDFTFTDPLALPSAGTYTVVVSIDQVNGNSDTNPADNSITQDVYAMTQIPDKNVVLFDITGAWCPYCPDGVATIHDIQTAHPDVIAVAVHVGDVMAITEGEDLVNPYVSGYPSGMVDVYKPGEEAVATSSRGAWQGRVENRMQTIVPVKITIPSSGWNAATRTIDVTVNAEFFAPMSGDLRLNAYIIEDEVTGGSQYDQANYYNNSPGHMFFGAGNPIVGFEHDHTLRAMLGGTWGQSGAVPGTVAAGAQHSYTFSYVLPAGHDETKIKLIGLIQRYDADENNREIYNATEKELKLWSTGIGSDEFAGDLEIYPNPASDFVNIVLNLEESRDLNIRVTDMFGRELTQIASETLPAGEHAFQWNGTTASGSFVANGFYFIEVRSDEGVSTRKVLLAR